MILELDIIMPASGRQNITQNTTKRLSVTMLKKNGQECNKIPQKIVGAQTVKSVTHRHGHESLVFSGQFDNPLNRNNSIINHCDGREM